MALRILIFFLIASIAGNAQNFNRPVPPLFPNYEFEVIDSSFSGQFTMGIRDHSGSKNLRWIVIIDRNGYLIWFNGIPNRQVDFHYHKAHNVFSITRPIGTHGQISHLLMDSTFHIIDTIGLLNNHGDIHDFQLLPNGNRLFLGKSETTVDLSAQTFDNVPGDSLTNIVSGLVLELNPNDSTVFSWNGIDYIHPSEFVLGIRPYNPQFFDYMHINSVGLDEDGHYLLSLRHTSSVVKINSDSGEIIWRLGGNSSDFKFINDGGFSGNHDVRSLGNSQYSIHDNGNLNSSKSRALILELDTTNMTAKRIREYYHSESLCGPAQGNTQVIEDGKILINWGRVYRPDPTFTLIDSLNNPMLNLYLKNNWISYRSYAYNIPINITRPVIQCQQKDGRVLLTAPRSSSYQWSTGEFSQSIQVADTGTFMVWLNKGIGYIGSEPFHIRDINSVCTTEVYQVDSSFQNDLLIGTFDLLGKEVSKPRIQQLYFLKYSSGRIRKTFLVGKIE